MNNEHLLFSIPAGFGYRSNSTTNISISPNVQPSSFSLQPIKVHITNASIESDMEKVSIHSDGSIGHKYITPQKSSLNYPVNRRHSLPAIAIDKIKSIISNKNSLSLTPPLETGESLISRRKKSIIGLFNTLGTNLGLVTPVKRSTSNLGSLHGSSSGSIDLIKLRHSLGILENLDPSSRNITSVPITSIDEIYYRPHRSFVRDILCCICFKKHDEYDNLIESHSCARIFTALVLLTIFCMLVGYIIKAAGEKRS